MSDADKSVFRGAQDRSLAVLVPAAANNPPVAAYPNFVSGAMPGTSEIVVLRRSVAELVTAFLAGETGAPFPGRVSVLMDEATEPPLAFQRALTLNPPVAGLPVRTGSAQLVDPNADPRAVIVDAAWASIPTFLVGQQRIGAVSRPTMQFIELRRRTAQPDLVVSFGVPIANIPLHQEDTSPAQSMLSTADVVDPARVPVVMRATHAYARSKGYAAGIPAFGVGTPSRLQIMFIKSRPPAMPGDAEDVHVVTVSTVRIPGPPVWHCADLPLSPSPDPDIPLSQIIINFPSTLAWTVAGRPPFATRVVMVLDSRLVEYADFPQPPAFAPIDVDTGGIQPAVIDGGGRPGRWIRDEVSAVDDGSMLHVLYYDGFVLHATRGPADADQWSTMTVDSSETDGLELCTNALVLRPTAGGPEVHAFYTTGNGVLRHAQFDGTAWTTEALDGHITDNDRRVVSMFAGVAALVEPDGRMHVFYYDKTAMNLRHAERGAGPWTFEVLDGSGGDPADGSGTGPTTAHVGRNPAAAWYDGRLYVFYDDETNSNVRMAVRRNVGVEERWSYGVVDGNRRRRGGVSDLVRATTAVVWSDRLSVFYYDAYLWHLRHAWTAPSWPSRWQYEIVDGAGGPNGRINDAAGAMPAALASLSPNGAPGLPVVVAHFAAVNMRWAVLTDPP
jgi:hypothetical protein